VRRLITISIGILLFGTTIDPTMLAQEVQGESTRKIVSRAVPVYPELARKMNLEGSVKLLVAVAPNGIVKSVHTIGGNPVLVKAAEDSVYKFRWIPANQESNELVEMKFQRKQQ
jgi:outer membrane biosynthesis protein TonB